MSGPEPLPSYGALPVHDGAPARSAWGLWGQDDRLGCLNLLTADRAAAAARLVQRGAVFALDAELDVIDPPLFGRQPSVHTVTNEDDPRSTSHDDVLDAWNTQASSQWDGFRHIPHPIHRFFNGLAGTDHGIDHWAARGIVGRGVLADVGRWRESGGRPLRMAEADPIEPEDVLGCLAAQRVVVEPGDILLLRTGWLGWYRDRSGAERAAMAAAHANPGLRPGEATAAMLWDMHIAAVAADNPSLEIWPPGAVAPPELFDEVRADRSRTPELFVHTALLPLLGLPIGELWDLDALAADCAEDGRFTFLLTSAPLHLRGGVASPPNALAVK
ncbi:MAG: cyclase family protein [Acidimicrobiales bacterium]